MKNTAPTVHLLHSPVNLNDCLWRLRAFTLIELLVVISIISLLISVLLPALANARKSARTISCSVKERSLNLAMIVYANDYRDYYPYSGASATGFSTVDSQAITWDDLLGLGGYDSRRLTMFQATYAQGVRYIAGNPTYAVDVKLSQTLYVCPEDGSKAPDQYFLRSYAINDGGMATDSSGVHDVKFLRGISADNFSKRIAEVQDPSGTFSLVEGQTKTGNRLGATDFAAMGEPYRQQGYAFAQIWIPFHNKTWNYAFVDGHIARLSPHATYGKGNYGGPAWDTGLPTVRDTLLHGSKGMWTTVAGD